MIEKLTLIGRGKAGWHGDGLTVVVSDEWRDWNDRVNAGHAVSAEPERTRLFSTFSVTSCDLAYLLGRADDDTLAYDLDACTTGDVIDFACKGPICRPGTPDSLKEEVDFGPLEWVSEYDICRYAGRLPGAKIGHVENREIVWE